MNKKLKKALYMFGFALPIVAIPIITVACGTQTSQVEPTPKQETPIQDENKKVAVSFSLSLSKIYDQGLLNDNVIELFKLFEEKSNLEKIKNYIEDISKKLDGLSILTTKELEKSSKTLEDFLNSINTSKIKIIKINETIKKSKEAARAAEDAIKLIDESFNEISKNATNLYKNLFLNQSSFDITNFSELKYNDFLSKLFEVRLSNFFNIENLKKHLQNLIDNNKLNEIVLKDIFSTNINNVIESLKNQDKQIKLDLIKTKEEKSNDKLLYNAIKENDPITFEKIKDDLIKDLTQRENIKSLLEKLTFSDLFDVDKLQEKLNQ